jgi:hypothetical protein
MTPDLLVDDARQHDMAQPCLLLQSIAVSVGILPRGDMYLLCYRAHHTRCCDSASIQSTVMHLFFARYVVLASQAD